MIKNETIKAKIYPFNASKDINLTSWQYLKADFSLPHLPDEFPLKSKKMQQHLIRAYFFKYSKKFSKY